MNKSINKSVYEDALETYSNNKNAAVGTVCNCPYCKTQFTKRVKQQAFCSHNGSSQCKDLFWTYVRQCQKKYFDKPITKTVFKSDNVQDNKQILINFNLDEFENSDAKNIFEFIGLKIKEQVEIDNNCVNIQNLSATVKLLKSQLEKTNSEFIAEKKSCNFYKNQSSSLKEEILIYKKKIERLEDQNKRQHERIEKIMKFLNGMKNFKSFLSEFDKL